TFRLKSMNTLDRKRRSLLRKLYPNMILLTQKSVHLVIIVEIRKLPDKMSDLEDFDHVFEQENQHNIARCRCRYENNGSGFIAENSG
ncbi:hypothetical protein L9F63_020922, partial [Diploptera punctata]